MTTLTRRTLIRTEHLRPASSAVAPATHGQARIDPRAMAARRDELRPQARAERDHTERGWFEQQVCREAP